jgi:hypothetical protein
MYPVYCMRAYAMHIAQYTIGASTQYRVKFVFWYKFWKVSLVDFHFIPHIDDLYGITSSNQSHRNFEHNSAAFQQIIHLTRQFL